MSFYRTGGFTLATFMMDTKIIRIAQSTNDIDMLQLKIVSYLVDSGQSMKIVLKLQVTKVHSTPLKKILVGTPLLVGEQSSLNHKIILSN